MQAEYFGSHRYLGWDDILGVQSIYPPTQGVFHLKEGNSAGPPDNNFLYQSPQDLPFAGDWNVDGKDSIGVYRPSTKTFFLSNSNTQNAAFESFQFQLGDTPISGDWNGDGKDTIGVYRYSNGTFYLRNTNSAGGADLTFAFGSGGGDIPIAGDWNGDGVDTIGVYRRSNATFYLRDSNSAGSPQYTFSYGLGGTTDNPVVGDWNKDGIDTIGVHRLKPGEATFYLNDANGADPPDYQFNYGENEEGAIVDGGALFVIPVSGDWNGDGSETVGLFNR